MENLWNEDFGGEWLVKVKSCDARSFDRQTFYFYFSELGEIICSDFSSRMSLERRDLRRFAEAHRLDKNLGAVRCSEHRTEQARLSFAMGDAVIHLQRRWLNRRSFVREAVGIAGSLYVRRAFGASADAPLEIATASGRLRGERAGDVNVFRGVPFAEPPVGDLRFRTAQAVRPWTGVREALEFAPGAIQPVNGAPKQSEDCLYLNIWAPASAGPHPVLVWIHGGGFTGGRASDPLFDGSVFAKEGVVCVTVAYRLGVFGFLDVSPLLGPSFAGSGNNALTDLIAALRWIQQNIGAFGGDPKRVTIGGESAGAKLTDVLMGVPSVSGLFSQMISESGGAERCWPLNRAIEVGQGFGTQWTRSGRSVSEMLTAEAGALLEAEEQFMHDWPAHFPLRPEVDGRLIPEAPVEAIAKGSAKGKRLLIGTMRDESAFFIGPHPAHDPKAADLGNVPMEQFAGIEDAYRKAFPELDAEMIRIRSVSAEEYWVPTMRVAMGHSDAGGKTYLYRFDYPGSGRFEHLAYHSFDLRFVWEGLGPDAPADERQLASTIHAAWVAFIKGGVPAAPGLPAWPEFTPDRQQTMIFDVKSRVEEHPQSKELALWNGVLTG